MFFAPSIRNTSSSSRAVAPAAGTMDGAFDRFLQETFSGLARPWQNLQEDEKSWTVTMDLPGVSREHLSVSVEGKRVRVETSEQSPRQFKGFYELPQEIHADGCEAHLENGVLTLKLAKVEQPDTRRQITIH